MTDSRREKLQKLIQASPDGAFLHFGLANELVKEGLQERAVSAFLRTIEIDPSYTAAYYHGGKTLLAMGKAGESRELLTRGVAAAKAISNDHALAEMQELLATVP